MGLGSGIQKNLFRIPDPGFNTACMPTFFYIFHLERKVNSEAGEADSQSICADLDLAFLENFFYPD